MTVGSNLLSHLSDMTISSNQATPSQIQLAIYRCLFPSVPPNLMQYFSGHGTFRKNVSAGKPRAERETKRSLSQALTTPNEIPQLPNISGPSNQHSSPNEEDNNRPNKCARIQRPSYVTIYVKKPGEKIYSALCLSKPTLDVLKEELANKYSIPKNMVAKFYKRTKKGLLIHMDNRMVEQFQDEDDFNIEISFQNKEGIFEVTFIY